MYKQCMCGYSIKLEVHVIYLEMSQNFSRKRKKYPCESIDGRKLMLNILNSEAPDTYCEFVVENISCSSLKRMLCIVIFLSVCSSICFLNHINVMVLFVVIILLCYTVFKILWTVKTETLLVVAPVGFQFNTTFLCGYENTQFIPWYCVSDVIINEAVSFQQVLFYLAVLIDQQVQSDVKRRLIPIFQYTKPRLRALELIYINVQRLFRASDTNVS